MATLISRLTSPVPAEARGVEVFSSWEKAVEAPLTDYVSYVTGAAHENGPVFALVAARALLLSEARFAFRDRDRNLHYGDGLALLEKPWANATTGDLITRMEQHASYGGNAYVYRDGNQLQILRPDRVTIISNREKVVAYAYRTSPSADPVMLDPSQVAHYAPYPDPLANWRGMSWITPVARELLADKKMSTHKERFFTNAAVPGMVIKVEKTLKPEERKIFEDAIARRYAGEGNAYKTMLVEGGADVQVVGSTMEQANFSGVQAAGENRLAAAAGVPPIVVGYKEGLQAATYSNYAQALRRFADLTIRPLWRNMAASLATVTKVPNGMELWYDDRDIPALQQDALDEAKINSERARAADTLIRAGYEPDYVAAVVGLPAIPHTGGIPTTLYPEGQDPGNSIKQGTPTDD